MPLKTITFRLAEERLQALDSIAELHQRDRSFVLNQAVAQYLSLNEYHRELILQGVKDDDAGEVINHAKVREIVAVRARKRSAR